MTRQHWATLSSGIQAFRRGTFYYFAIPKNGLTTFIEFFEKRKWQRVNIWNEFSHGNTNITIFAHIRNPYERYIKGIVESIISKDLMHPKDFDFIENMIVENPRWADYITTAVTDDHTGPFSNMIPSFISPYQINWIPLDHPEFNSNFLLNHFFREHNLPIKINEDKVLNKAQPETKKMREILRKHMYRSDEYAEHARQFFEKSIMSEDVQIYNHVMRQYEVKTPYLRSVALQEEQYPEWKKTDLYWHKPIPKDSHYIDWVKHQKDLGFRT